MDTLREHEVINTCDPFNDEENERVLDRLSRNDPTLKKLTLVMPRDEGIPIYDEGGLSNFECMLRLILRLFDEIEYNSSLKVLDLDLCSTDYLYYPEVFHRVTRALSLNMSLNEIRINTTFGQMRGFFDIVRASPNLKELTIRIHSRTNSLPNLEDITAMVQVLRVHMNLHCLTIEGHFAVLPAEGAAFAAAFQANQTIKTLIMRDHAINQDAGVSFVEALPHEHSLETIIFDRISLNDDSAMSIIRTLCHTPLKVLSLAVSCWFTEISQDGSERIVQTLKENDHGFTKLDLFQQDFGGSPWQNKIQLEIDMLTLENRLQVEKDTWVNRFLEQGTPSQELLFRALERAKKVDNERFTKAPNMLFHLIKESPALIVQAIRDGL